MVGIRQRGAALPLAVMLVLVLSVLGTALWRYSTTDLLHAARHERSTQAYYIARSGAEALAEYIITNPANVEDMRDFIDELLDTESDEVDFGRGSFVLTVERDEDDPSRILINSRAQVQEVPAEVSLTLIENYQPLEGTPLDVFFKYAIYSYTDLTLGGNVKVFVHGGDGELGTVAAEGSVISRGAAGEYEVEDDPDLPEFKSVETPAIDTLENKGSLDMSGGDLTVDEDSYFSSIDLSGGTLTFETEENRNLTIRVGSFRMSGNNTRVKINGGGTVFFHVDDKYRQTTGKVNPWGTDYDGKGSPTPHQFILLNARTVHFGGGAEFVGYIYSVEETEGFGVAGNPDIYGAVIFGSASDFGNARVHYVDPTAGGAPPIGDPSGGGEIVSYTTGRWR